VAEDTQRASRRIWTRVAETAARHLAPEQPPLPTVPEQPPEAVLDFLRRLGVAMCRAGDPVDRVTLILEDVARSYGARGVSFFVLPTGVFVRIETAESSRVDFAPGSNTQLRLDQIDDLYRLIDDIRHAKVTVTEASAQLESLLAAKPRFPDWVRVVGGGVLTVGLGLMLNPTASALPVYLGLGLLVGALRVWSERTYVVSLVFPVLAAFAVTWAAFTLAQPELDAWPLDIVIPSLVTLLPGAALTIATIELAAGSVISGSTRLVSGLERLLLLTFGIAMGIEVAGLPDVHARTSATLGVWAPWVGVLVFGVGHFLDSSMRRRSFLWVLLVLYVAYAVQAGSALLLGPLGASFVAGAVVLPTAYAVQERRSGPPVPVTFLPAFWMLVPGALGLQGVTELVGSSAADGLGDFLSALLTIVAIAVGVLVGTGLSERIGRVTSTWRGL
jgi:uncharacterized membrane protein YjjP (DUF1212 family)